MHHRRVDFLMPRLLWALLFLVLAPLFASPAFANEDFLKPEQAFKASAKPDGAEALVIDWSVEPGYYLYRSKFRFVSETPGIQTGPIELPAAEVKNDEFFGEVEIHRGDFEARVPLERTEDGGRRLALEVSYQGCADAGFCYPPEKRRFEVRLPRFVAATPAPSAGIDRASGAADPAPASPFSLGFGLEDDILPAEEAFVFEAQVVDPNRLSLRWLVAPGTYLYEEKLALRLEDAEGVRLGDYRLPPAKIKSDTVRPDGSIGDIAVYESDVSLEVPLLRTSGEPTEIRLIADYQGCAARGICYPPQTTLVALALPATTELTALPADADAANDASGEVSGTTAAATTAAASAEPGDAAASAVRVSEQDQIAARLANAGILGAVAIFFGLGLLLAFTPCVFPMIPILSGIIAGQGKDITTRKAFLLSLSYVLAMALTYAVVGVIAGLFGANLQATFQNPWVLSVFAAVFVALALSMFGFYELQLPSSLQTKLTELSNKQEGGKLTGAAIMGSLSALIVGPCVAPPLMGALIFIGQTGDAVLGFFALLGLGLGMGAPLLAIGTSAGKLLPRAGMWMDAVKAVFGVLLLAVAIILLERILPSAVALLLWGLLLIASGVYMGALTPLDHESSGWRKLWKSLGLALLIYGGLMLVGMAAGGKDTIQPLRGILPAGGSAGGVAQAEFKLIKTVEDLEREVAAASAAGKPVMLDFYADWCVSCIEMKRYTFPDPQVIAEMEGFVLLQADVTANDAADKALMQERFGIPGPPAMLFFDADGQEQRGFRLVGFVPPDEFAAHLREFQP